MSRGHKLAEGRVRGQSGGESRSLRRSKVPLAEDAHGFRLGGEGVFGKAGGRGG